MDFPSANIVKSKGLKSSLLIRNFDHNHLTGRIGVDFQVSGYHPIGNAGDAEIGQEKIGESKSIGGVRILEAIASLSHKMDHLIGCEAGISLPQACH